MPCWSQLRPWGLGKVNWTLASLAVLLLRTHLKIHSLKIRWDVGLFPTTETYEEGPAWSAPISTFFQIIHSQLAIAPAHISGVRWGLWGTSLDWHPNKCVLFLLYQPSQKTVGSIFLIDGFRRVEMLSFSSLSDVQDQHIAVLSMLQTMFLGVLSWDLNPKNTPLEELRGRRPGLQWASGL